MRTTVDDLLLHARARLRRVTPQQAHDHLRLGTGTLVDTRVDASRRRDGEVAGALVTSLNVLEWRLDPTSSHRHPLAPGLGDLVMVLCEQGYSSSLAAARLQDIGFTRATDVIGGVEAWRAAGLPLVAPSTRAHA